MSLSPKQTTPFSVTDILSPIEETYKRTTIEAAIPPLTPYRNHSQYPSPQMGSMSVPVTNPYHGGYVPQLTHHTPSYTSQFCNGTEFGHYGDPTRHGSANWYGTNPDPRLASKYPPLSLKSTVQAFRHLGGYLIEYYRIFLW